MIRLAALPAILFSLSLSLSLSPYDFLSFFVLHRSAHLGHAKEIRDGRIFSALSTRARSAFVRRTSTPECRRRSVIIDRHSYINYQFALALIIQVLFIRGATWTGAVRVARPEALTRSDGFLRRGLEEISFVRGGHRALSFATMADLYSFIKPARPFVRPNGIRDASGLSTSELGRFTALGRDRAASGSEPTVSTFQLDPLPLPPSPPRRERELRP